MQPAKPPPAYFSNGVWVNSEGRKRKSVKNTTNETEITEKEGLTGKQKLFCEHYAVHHNASAAARAAGYSAETSGAIGAENLKKVSIRKYIDQLEADSVSITKYSREWTIRQIGLLAESNLSNLFDEEGRIKPKSEWTDAEKAAVSGIDNIEMLREPGVIKKIKMHDKTKALEMLAKMHKVYSDAPVVNNNNQNNSLSFDEAMKLLYPDK